MTILLLAGTGEAREIATVLAREGRPALASIAGATRAPVPLPLPTRRGGFGSAEGFAAFLTSAGITGVLDATHPFAAAMSRRSAAICAQAGVPYCLVSRPPWTPRPGDRWVSVPDEAGAVRAIAPGSCVFLATGRQTLERFAGLRGRRVYCRQIDPPRGPFPFAGGRWVVGRPPFTRAHEMALFRRLGVDWLVVKNAGGARSRSKLDAARRLRIPVAMIERPALPDAPVVTSVDAALAWLAALP